MGTTGTDCPFEGATEGAGMPALPLVRMSFEMKSRTVVTTSWVEV